MPFYSEIFHFEAMQQNNIHNDIYIPSVNIIQYEYADTKFDEVIIKIDMITHLLWYIRLLHFLI